MGNYNKKWFRSYFLYFSPSLLMCLSAYLLIMVPYDIIFFIYIYLHLTIKAFNY